MSAVGPTGAVSVRSSTQRVTTMHDIIYALVEVDPDDEYPEDAALGQGKSVFDELVGIGAHAEPVFDYYTTFDDDSSNVSGPGRYGEKPNALPVDSHGGARMLYNGWKWTCKRFEKNLDEVRSKLDELSNEEVMSDKDFVRNKMYRVGQYRGSDILLYHQHIGSIRDQRSLDRALDTAENLWIVPADVHY